MRIAMTSVFVNDQEAAQTFYTDILGFTLKHKEPIGADYWLTVVSPETPDGPELLLEPSSHQLIAPKPAADTHDTAAS